MTCPRCTHEIYPQDALEFIVSGQAVHALQTCFDFLHADLAARTAALATLTATIGALQQAAITARTSEAQAVADTLDIQAQVDQVNGLKADNAAKASQITQLTATVNGHNQALADVQTQLAIAQTNILAFARERDAVILENTDLKVQIGELMKPVVVEP